MIGGGRGRGGGYVDICRRMLTLSLLYVVDVVRADNCPLLFSALSFLYSVLPYLIMYFSVSSISPDLCYIGCGPESERESIRRLMTRGFYGSGRVIR